MHCLMLSIAIQTSWVVCIYTPYNTTHFSTPSQMSSPLVLLRERVLTCFNWACNLSADPNLLHRFIPAKIATSLVEFIYLVFTGILSENHRRRFGPLLLCLCEVFWALINSLVCWFISANFGSYGHLASWLASCITTLCGSITRQVGRRRCRLPLESENCAHFFHFFFGSLSGRCKHLADACEWLTDSFGIQWFRQRKHQLTRFLAFILEIQNMTRHSVSSGPTADPTWHQSSQSVLCIIKQRFCSQTSRAAHDDYRRTKRMCN